MPTAAYSTPGSLSSNLVSTELNSLANGSESAVVTYDNSSNLALYASITILLGSITPGTAGSVSLRVTCSDGTNTADKADGDLYPITLATGASAKIAIIPMVRLYPFPLLLSVVNNSGVTLASSGNAIHARAYGEAS